MENPSNNATVPAQSAATVKGRDFEPPPTSTDIQPNDPAAGGKPPYGYGAPGGSGDAPPEKVEPGH
jgi:hypothetical protein